jgi:hypothetical protein
MGTTIRIEDDHDGATTAIADAVKNALEDAMPYHRDVTDAIKEGVEAGAGDWTTEERMVDAVEEGIKSGIHASMPPSDEIIVAITEGVRQGTAEAMREWSQK